MRQIKTTNFIDLAKTAPGKHAPLASAITLALLGLASGQAHAIGCNIVSPGSGTFTSTVADACYDLVNGGSLIVTGADAFTSSAEMGTTALNVYDTLASTTNYSANRGTANFLNITIGNGGHLAGPVFGGTDVMIDSGGTFSLKTGFTASDIANTGSYASTALVGNLMVASGATLNIGIGDATSTTSFEVAAGPTTQNAGESSFITTGLATLSGGTLHVDTKASSGLAAGQHFFVIRGPINGSGFDSITDNSAAFNFTQSLVAGSLTGTGFWLTVINASTILQSTINRGNFPGVGAATVFDAGHGGLSSVVSAIGGLSSEQEISDAVSSTLPLFTGNGTGATQSALSSINRVVQARVEGNKGLSSGDEFYGDKYIWFKPFGSWADQGNVGAVSGFDAKTFGFALGADNAVSGKLRLGGAFAYAKSEVDSKSSVAKQSGKIDIYQLIGYGSYTLDERTELNFQFDAGQNQNDGTRYITAPASVAEADYASWSAHAGVGVGRIFTLNEKDSVTGSVRADYTWIKDEAYTETGAGVLNLNVKSRSTDAMLLSADAKFNRKLDNQTQLSANLGIGYDLLSDKSSVTAAFAGAPSASFVTYGLDPSPWLFRAGFGASRQTGKGMEITGRYDAEYRQDFLNQSVSVKLRWSL